MDRIATILFCCWTLIILPFILCEFILCFDW